MMLRNLIIIAILFSSVNLFAKEKQIGYYDSLAVMTDSIIWSDAKRYVKNFQAVIESKLSDMEKALSAEEEKYAASKDSISEKERVEFEAEIIERKQILEDKKLRFAMDMEIMHEKLYTPIILNVSRAIQTLISKHKLSKLVAMERLIDTEKPNALNLTQELIAEVIRLEKLRIVAD